MNQNMSDNNNNSNGSSKPMSAEDYPTTQASKALFESMMVQCYWVEPSTCNALDPKDSKNSQEYKRSQNLLETSSRLADGSEMLGEIVKKQSYL